MNSPNALKQLQYESRELFGILSSQFTGDFDPTNHSTELSMPLPEFHPFFEAFVETIPGAPIDVEVRYIPKLGKLDFATLRLAQRNNTNLLLKRPFSKPDLFLRFHESKDRMHEELLTMGDETFPLEPKQISKFLALADICMPMFLTTPEDYRRGIADLRRNSRRWSSVDTRTIPYAPLRTLRFEQRLAEEVPDAVTDFLRDGGAQPQRRTARRVSSPRRDPEANPTSVALTATNEVIDVSGVRRQVVISFAGTFYNSGRPKIYGRTLRPDMLLEAFNIRDADPNNRTYEVTEYYDPLETSGNSDMGRQLELVKNMADVVVKALLF